MELGDVSATPMRDRGVDEEGRRYWRARTGPSKARRTLWTGWATREQVEVVVADLVRKGIPSPRSDRAVARTVADLMARWTEHQEKRREGGQIAARSLTNYKQAARYWKDAIGDVSLRALTRVLVEDTITEWLAEGVAPRTAKLAVDVLAAATIWGAQRELCARVELGRLAVLQIRDDEHVMNVRTPESGEVAAALERMAGWHQALLSVQALTGARIGEVAALHVRDWDRAGAELEISGRDELRDRRGKVRARRWPVLAELGELLGRLAGDRPGDERLVEGVPREFVPQLGRALREACVEAKVEPFTSHGIRRMVATELLASGEDHKRVSELTGHSVLTLLRFYARPSRRQLRESVARARLSLRPKRGAKVIPIGGGSEDSEP